MVTPDETTPDPVVNVEIPDFDAGEPEPEPEAPDICDNQFKVVYRDFSDTHPDMENRDFGISRVPGMVEPRLSADGKPVFTDGKRLPVTSPETFDQWYRDVDGVNVRIDSTLVLSDSGNGSLVYDSEAFFPLDNQGFGNQGRQHNFHFTTELRARFVYRGGEEFRFRGDDDVWVFVDGNLALDLGGVSPPTSRVIDFDDLSAALNLEVGREYTLAIFHAERQTSMSNFRVETSIGCVEPEPLEIK